MAYSIPLPNSQICLLAALTALLSHHTYFIRGEHHLQAALYFYLSLLVPVVSTLLLDHFTDLTLSSAAILTAEVVTTYFTTLWASILIYRIYFHPLVGFKGPDMAKTSKLWHFWMLTKRMDNFRLLEAWHQTYGDFVRTGPNEITIFDPDGVTALLGTNSKCTKSAWYDGNAPIFSLHTVRDKSFHDQRRKIWDRGFGAKALRSYEPRVSSYSHLLCRQLKEHSGKPVSATEWLHFYSFDVMGDIAFGRSFGLLENGKMHYALDLLVEGMKPLGTLAPVPWVVRVLRTIPGAGRGFKRFIAWCGEQVEERKKMSLEVPDVMSWLITSFEKGEHYGNKKQEQDLLEADAQLIIVAGSDTTASTLTYIFYHLAHDPTLIARLRAELKALSDSLGGTGFSVKDLQNVEFLNGLINETLRMHPAVPSGVFRVTPPEGIDVNGTFIPGEVTVLAPSYSIGRLESAYAQPNDFIPERWYSRPELIKNKGAFAPFSIGPFSCVGKQLALMELRSVVAELVTQFEVKFAPGEDGTALLEDSKDFFTVSLADLRLVFTERAA